mmetsp:Transcript_12229/g.16042  ORF Transcript_12229/g.16042 Transcript_12229/m.16042 type:complete len:435 (-) Transcript_12229:508-1812(-)
MQQAEGSSIPKQASSNKSSGDEELSSMFPSNYVPSVPPALKKFVPAIPLAPQLLQNQKLKSSSNHNDEFNLDNDMLNDKSRIGDTNSMSNDMKYGFGMDQINHNDSPPFKQNRMSQDSSSSTETNILRKGKWTVEEEEFTTKIIHYFNTGVLQLPEGTTLRSFLAEKLNCDPMRITKKFTGSQCLGKRVYHQCDVLQASHAQVLAALEELAVLERRFKLRLEREKQKNRHEMDSETTVLHAGNVVSTPAIDAMVLESRGIKAWHSAPCHPDLPFEQLPYHAFQLCGPKIFHQRSSYKINHYSHQTPSAMINYHSINNLFSSPKEEISDQMDQSHLSNHSHQDYLPIAPVHSDFTHSMDTATSSANESNSCPETQTPNDDDASGLLMGFFNHMRRSNSQNDLVQFAVEINEAAHRGNPKNPHAPQAESSVQMLHS